MVKMSQRVDGSVQKRSAASFVSGLVETFDERTSLIIMAPACKGAPKFVRIVHNTVESLTFLKFGHMIKDYIPACQ